mgnify:CR=1 FL=1
MTRDLDGRRILLVIGGGIAAYKALDLIRRLRERGARVRPILTQGAQEFVTPLAAAALAGERAHTDLFDRADEAEIGHIRLAREADAVVVGSGAGGGVIAARLAQAGEFPDPTPGRVTDVSGTRADYARRICDFVDAGALGPLKLLVNAGNGVAGPAFDAIAAIRSAAHRGKVERPRWPMIVLRSPKGWTGPETVDGKPVEGTWRAHQVPVAAVRDNADHRAILEAWMRSYRPEELFGQDGALVPELAALPPKGRRRISANPHANAHTSAPLRLPDLRRLAVAVPEPGRVRAEATRVLLKEAGFVGVGTLRDLAGRA